MHFTLFGSRSSYLPAMKWFRSRRKKAAQPGPARVSRRAIKAAETRPVPGKPSGQAGGGNPYESQSWQLDPEKGLRRVDDANTVTRERSGGDASDPYNTGGFVRGW